MNELGLMGKASRIIMAFILFPRKYGGKLEASVIDGRQPFERRDMFCYLRCIGHSLTAVIKAL